MWAKLVLGRNLLVEYPGELRVKLKSIWGLYSYIIIYIEGLQYPKKVKSLSTLRGKCLKIDSG